MALGSIVIDLLIKTGAFETDTKRAEKRLAELGKAAKTAGAVIGTALVAGVGAATVAIKSSIDAMDEMSKAALKSQMPTEQFSQLAYAGSLADVALEDLTVSMGRLTKAQAAALSGSKTQEEAFKSLGISFANADGILRNTRDVFLDFAEAFEQNQDSPEMMALGMQIFGKSFQNLIPLLKDGRDGLEAAADEADRLGVTLSTQAGQQAEEFNDNLTRLKSAALGLSQEVASKLLPTLIELSNDLLAMSERGNLAANAATVLDGVLRAGVGVLSAYENAVSRTTIAFGVMANAAAGAKELVSNFGVGGIFNEGSVSEGFAKVKAAFSQGQAELDALLKKSNSPFANVIGGSSTSSGVANPSTPRLSLGGGGAKKSSVPKAGKSDAELEADRLASAYKSLNEQLDREITLYGQVGEAARVRYEVEQGALENLAPAMKEALLEKAKWTDWQDEMAEVESVWADVAQEQADRQIALANKASEATDIMSEFSSQAARNMQSAFADFLFDPFENGLEGLAKSFSETLRKMAAEMISSKVLEFIGSWASSYTGGGSSWINMIGGALTQKKAAGGHIVGAGSGTSDSIPAYLSNGEYVIKASAVSKYGKGFFDNLNAQRFASGGYVGGSVPASSVGSGLTVIVENHGEPVKARAEEGTSADGGKLIKVILDMAEDRIAGSIGNMGKVGKAAATRFGLTPAGVMRG